MKTRQKGQKGKGNVQQLTSSYRIYPTIADKTVTLRRHILPENSMDTLTNVSPCESCAQARNDASQIITLSLVSIPLVSHSSQRSFLGASTFLVLTFDKPDRAQRRRVRVSVFYLIKQNISTSNLMRLLRSGYASGKETSPVTKVDGSASTTGSNPAPLRRAMVTDRARRCGCRRGSSAERKDGVVGTATTRTQTRIGHGCRPGF
jgi:hypothetical protein